MNYNDDHRSDKIKDPFDRIRHPFKRFLHIESSGGILLILATIVALIVANSGLGSMYESFFKQELTIGIPGFQITESILHWINDGLMSVFFFLVGLEIKRELLVGELSSPKKAALPIIAAVGGMIVPAAMFIFFVGDGLGKEGWGIPMATDIAFSLGVLSLLGKRVPLALKVFLVAFAIVDDIGAIVIIALFYSHEIHWSMLLISFGLLAFLFIINKANIRYIPIYITVGFIIWFLFLHSGIHATIAGVLFAFTIPSSRKIDLEDFTVRMKRNLKDFEDNPHTDDVALQHTQLAAIDNMQSQIYKIQSPLQKLEHSFHGFVTFFVMPIFAFANAGVVLQGAGLAGFSTLTLSISSSLIFGKIIGIFLFAYLTVKLGLSALPDNVNWKHILGAAMLGGIGFTMSLFISNLAYENIGLLRGLAENQAKLGILLGSLTAAVLGFVYLKIILSKE
ncbi:MAG: Na+/H+ antiporter NhaA [Bacteroidales bacterium]|nr:Na+/H+ antiporter NhaA [Bacteroidales bacterium]